MLVAIDSTWLYQLAILSLFKEANFIIDQRGICIFNLSFEHTQLHSYVSNLIAHNLLIAYM